MTCPRSKDCSRTDGNRSSKTRNNSSMISSDGTKDPIGFDSASMMIFDQEAPNASLFLSEVTILLNRCTASSEYTERKALIDFPAV
mmetsp:Transcript_17047/g.41856  ORF Transcript_17047/g.41856 Transcript_17047/m.41856 type:complete len:86 (-) Transcript_17047:154-411(-)